MPATHHFHQRLQERYGVVAWPHEVETWEADIQAGRAELVWVYPDRASRVYRLVHRRAGLDVFAVRFEQRFITVHVSWSYERLRDGWRQRGPVERHLIAKRRERFRAIPHVTI